MFHFVSFNFLNILTSVSNSLKLLLKSAGRPKIVLLYGYYYSNEHIPCKNPFVTCTYSYVATSLNTLVFMLGDNYTARAGADRRKL